MKKLISILLAFLIFAPYAFAVPVEYYYDRLLNKGREKYGVDPNQDTGIQNNFSATVDPTVNDDDTQGYELGSRWINTTTDTLFTCTDSTIGSAVWVQNGSIASILASLVDTVTTSFDNILSTADTNVQLALDTIDDMLFIDIQDTPSSYTSEGGKVLQVNSGENAVEFTKDITVDSIDEYTADNGVVVEGVAFENGIQIISPTSGADQLTIKNNGDPTGARSDTITFEFSDGDGGVIKATRPSIGTNTDTFLSLFTGGNTTTAKAILSATGEFILNSWKLGTPTYNSVQDYFSQTNSAGWISGGTFSDNGDGTMTVGAGTGIIRTTNDSNGDLLFFNWAENSSVSLVTQDNNYIAVNYNSGSPIITSSTTSTANGNTIFNLGLVFREGTDLHFARAGQVVNDIPKKVIQRFNAEGILQLTSGGIVTETGTRNLAVTESVLYGGLTRFNNSAIDTSGTDTFEYYYTDGLGGWQYISETATQINNTQYDNGGTLTSLTSNRYRTDFIYLSHDGELLVILGQNNGSLRNAQAVQPPTSLPPHAGGFSSIIAKIIVREGETNLEEIDNLQGISFSSSGTFIHNDASGLQGGDTDEYYHLDATEFGYLDGQDQGVSVGDNVEFAQITSTGLSGMLKTVAGVLTDAVADTDYQQAISWGDGLEYSAPTASVDYNTTNLKITSNELNTIQDIATTSTPQFSQIIIGTPVSGNNAATKTYVDDIASNIKWREQVEVATTANITLSGEQTIDGVLTSSNRVLVKNQTDQTENGIYVSGSGAWTRATDVDTGVEIYSSVCRVVNGTTNGTKSFVNTNTTEPTIGSDNITFGIFDGGLFSEGDGINIIGGVISADIDTTNLQFASGAIDTKDTITADLTGNADTATALASNPTDCGSNTFAQSINASGDLTCASVDISDDTNLGVSGTLLNLTGDTLSINEGTLTDGKLCTYSSSGTQLVCNTDTSAVGFSDPMTTRGDIIYKNSSNITTRLPVGTINQVLKSDGTDISWDDTLVYETNTSNLFGGSLAGTAGITGTSNTSYGYASLDNIATGGNSNTSVGTYSMEELTTQDNNTCIGNLCMENIEAITGGNSGNNTCGGIFCMQDIDNSSSYNNSFGSNSFSNLAGGDYNNSFGSNSGLSLETGTGNNNFGYRAGYYNISANNNANFGGYAGEENIEGSNANFGSYTRQNGTLGKSGVYIGAYSGYHAKIYDEITAVADNGSGNARITSSGHQLSTGDSIVISGTTSYNGTYTITVISTSEFDISASYVASETGSWNIEGSDGDENTCLGAYSCENLKGNNVTFLGYKVGSGLRNVSNKIAIDTSNTATPLIWGDTSLKELTINGNLEITGQAYSPQDSTLTPTGTTQTIDWDDSNSAVLDLESATGDVTLTLSNGNAGASYTIKVIQGATAREIIFPTSSPDALFPGGTQPSLCAVENCVNLVTLYFDGTDYLTNITTDFQ